MKIDLRFKILSYKYMCYPNKLCDTRILVDKENTMKHTALQNMLLSNQHAVTLCTYSTN